MSDEKMFSMCILWRGPSSSLISYCCLRKDGSYCSRIDQYPCLVL